MKKNHNIIEITVLLKRQTNLAVLVQGDIGEKPKDVWLPKSQVEIEPLDEKDFVKIQLPVWLAEDKGLI